MSGQLGMQTLDTVCLRIVDLNIFQKMGSKEIGKFPVIGKFLDRKERFLYVKKTYLYKDF